MQNSQEHCSSNWDGWVTVQKPPGWLCMHAPRIQSFTRPGFYTLCDVFLCTVGGFYRKTLLTIKTQKQESHSYTRVTPPQRLVQQYKDEQLLPHVSRWGRALTETSTAARPRWEADSLHVMLRALWDPDSRAGDPLRPWPAQCSAPPSPKHVRPPRIRPSHLTALAASGYADCLSFFSMFHF